VDSPGGSAAASDAIWRELMLARNERADRPIVVSMSDLAASGGYYIAMPAQVIVAAAVDAHGSIGIFGGKFVTGGIYEKLGAHIESTSIGRNAELNSPARRYNTTELEKVQETAAGVLRPVRREGGDGAAQHPEKIDQLAQGRVWTGRQAHDNGLRRRAWGVDERDRPCQEAGKDPCRQRRRIVGLSADEESFSNCSPTSCPDRRKRRSRTGARQFLEE
jgi:protease-4